jgi:hypothetical protein
MRNKLFTPNDQWCWPETPPQSRSGDPDQPCFPERPDPDDEGCFPESPARRRHRRADPRDLLDLLDSIRPR